MITYIYTSLIFLFSLSAMAQQTTYSADTMKYLELNGTTNQYDHAIDQLFVMLKKQYASANIPDTVWKELKNVKPQELTKIKSLLVAAYRSSFSQEEVQEMIAFYESPAGRQVVADPRALSSQQKDAFTLFRQSVIGLKIENTKESLSSMVGEVSEMWSRELYENITAKLESKGYSK